jgi:peptide/nickel transport system ATP-binding protein
MSRYPHQFSGGQRQRICIARALATEPQFLVFDESVSALDLSIQAQILNLINELKAELKFTCLFISHDLPVVHYISDRILVLQNGVIIESGTADQILHAPAAKYTRSLVDAIPGRAFFTN